jgi:hypothetical protein
MKKTVILCSLAAAAAGYWAGHVTTVSAASAHVFEFRRYTVAPGKLDELQARFRDHTDAIFKKHNMTSVGYFAPQDDPLNKNTFMYILEFPSRDAAKKSWDEFRADPAWIKVQKESEANGKLVDHVESIFTSPYEFSKLK